MGGRMAEDKMRAMSEIEKGIPIPGEKRLNLEDKFPQFLKLEVGDSFVISEKDFSATCFIEIANFGTRNRQCHEVRELSNKNFRVWRTA
jgi:hypothetical protein